jgi:ABC-type Fe3+/spermidine/putrescine transport system ATPase subunit
MKTIINNHNKHVLDNNNRPQQTQTAECNCKVKDNCPLNGRCRTSDVIYQATVQAVGKQEETYIGASEKFKARFYNHTSSFKHRSKEKDTELSKYVWSLKDSNVQYAIKWKIIQRGRAYSSAAKRCNLCLNEKLHIICHPDKCTLNKRNELVSSCRHRNKFLLSQLK